MDTRWERYHGGSAEAERVRFEKLAKDILRVQHRVKTRSRNLNIDRAFHAKALLAVANAAFVVSDALPFDLEQGFIKRGRTYPTTVRFSNASGTHQTDGARDLRGAALRIAVSDAERHDLLMTNFPVPHARDAEQFVKFALAMSGNRLIGIVGLLFTVGPSETIRMLRNVSAGASRKVESLALESFWSRGAMLWGLAGPVRYFMRPAAATAPASGETPDLRREIAGRLAEGDVRFELCVQRFVDETRTPIEDAAHEWELAISPAIVVATLVIPQQDIFAPDAEAVAREIDALAFNPWLTTDAFRPLGNLNRARKMVYQASAAHRRRLRFHAEVPLVNRAATGALVPLFATLNRLRPWHRLPLTLSLLNLSLFRHRLRAANLIDTDLREAPPKADQDLAAIPEAVRIRRTFDGSHNDLSEPTMGKVGATFGRNMAPQYRPDLFDTPSPIIVSRELLYRERFIPATTLNVLAAAWIQFQVHDWVQHGRYPLGKRDIRVPMPNGTRWRNTPGGPDEAVMRIAGDRPRVEADPASGRPPILFANTVSHWWDGSEVYGADEAKARALTEGAHIRLENGYLPRDMSGAEVTGFNESWWLGLSAMHTLFAREHNAVVDALKSEYRAWSDARIYDTARLVISALIAKIHTVEWTPAILATQAIDIGLNANWAGPPSDILTRLGLWLTDRHGLKAIPATTPDHHAAPYCLTEDFVTVYRMHPLLPDDYALHSRSDGRLLARHTFDEIQGTETDEVMRERGLGDVLYSLGIAHPGAITLHNYPRALQAFTRRHEGVAERIDLSVVDLMRERTRGIPRYNAFRKGLHKSPVRSFEEITENPESVRRLKDIYRSVDEIDTMVGLFAETPPVGFGFSDTAFRIFILMATRRLQSDRFLTVDFRPEIYSPLGLAWVRENGMTSVILRHHPELAGLLPRSQSAFAPWRPAVVV